MKVLDKLFFSRARTLKSLLRINGLILISVFIVLLSILFLKSYQTLNVAVEKQLNLFLEQEVSVLNQRFSSYKMTLESVQTLLNKAIRNKGPLNQGDIESVILALISSQPYVYNVFYAFEPEYARLFKNEDYYIFASLKNFDLFGTPQFSEKKNIKSIEYFDGEYIKYPDESNKRWYHSMKNQRSLIMTDAYYDPTYMKFTMFTAVLALTDENDKFAGIVGLDIPLSVLIIENAKRTSPLGYRSIIVDRNGVPLEELIEEDDFDFPHKFKIDDEFGLKVGKINIDHERAFKITGADGKIFNAVSRPIFDDQFELVVLKSKARSLAPLLEFYKDIVIALAITLLLQVLLTNNISRNIYRNTKILFNNFKKNTKRIKKSRDTFKPIYLKNPLEIIEIDEARKHWEHFLSEFNIVLNEAKVEKDKSLKAVEFQSVFLANMSHEIRTPMNAILGMIELLKETPLSEKQQEILEIFSSSSDNLLALLNDILDLAKIESGNMKIEKTCVDLFKIKKDIVGIYNEKAHKKGLDFQFIIEENVHPYIKTDPLRLKQIIFNLTSNALKFTSEGFVEVRILKGNTNKELIIKVSDSGVGIPKNKRKYIFKKFAQADVSTTRKFGGSGLGLSIVKSLVDLMKGNIQLKSSSGEGSAFTILLPVDVYHPNLQTTTGGSEASHDDPAKITPIASASSFKVLIADDVLENRLMLDMYAKIFNVKCEMTENGLEATEKVKTNAYDLIILDIQMPLMDGVDALKAIKKISPNVPVIAFSAFASKTDEAKYMAEGFDGYLTKPLSKQKFFECLNKYLIK